MIRFLSSDFSVSRRRTRVDRPKFQLLLAVIIKVGAQGEGATNRTFGYVEISLGGIIRDNRID